EGQIVWGDPTEAALLAYAQSVGLDKIQLTALFPRLFEVPFDSERKRMTTVHSNDGRIIQFTKGSPDEVLAVCTHMLFDGQELEITEEDREAISTRADGYASGGLRVLAAAFKEYTDEFPEDVEAKLEAGVAIIESEMSFIGLICLEEAIHPEAEAAIASCKAAGITPIMITGDHKGTAVAIAKQLELIQDESQAVTGAEMAALSPAALEERVESIGVYARMASADKAKILAAWRRKGYVCAMAGGSVDSVPIIKAADIGIAVGSGTDAAKNAADMVLNGESLENIVAAVSEARRIYDSVRRVVAYMLSANLAKVLAVFMATMFGFMILRPMHLLWISLVAGILPALALAFENRGASTLQSQPRPRGEGVLAGGVGVSVLYYGMAGAVMAVVAYFAGSWLEHGVFSLAQSGYGVTMAFLTLSFYETLHVLTMRGIKGGVFAIFSYNKRLYGAIGLALFATLVAVYLPPFSGILGFTIPSAAGLAVCFALGALVVPIASLQHNSIGGS
ncbi:MAG: cation-translocating P-type ATPase, partial [Defluviitaleaceae bacterium]|nr:cation-translocating P-type ATPase [Defluviitaleaceae bacterium]